MNAPKFSTIIAAMSLFVLIGCEAKPDPAPVTQKTPEAGFVEELAQKSGGDISKLTPDERAKLDSITRGHSEIALKSAVKK